MSVRLLENAVTLYQSGDLSGAKIACQKILTSSKNLAPPVFILACIARDEGHLDHAVTKFKQAIKIDSGQYHFYVNLGDTYDNLGRFSEALAEFQESLKYVDTPENEAIIFHKIGNIHRSISNIDAALTYFKKSITLAPNRAEPHTSVGMVYNDLGDLKLAESAHRKAIELNPTLPEAYNNLGLVLVNDRRTEEGIETYQRLIELAPKFTPAYKNLGNALLQLGKHNEALVALSRYVELQGEDVSASHMINALTGQPADTAPVEYVEKLFDDFAGHFEEHLVEDLEYDIPAKMIASLKQHVILAEGQSHTVLDLGCGTGLVGALLEGHCEAIDGVDLSQGMLDQAKEKGIYRQLFKCELVSFLQSSGGSESYNFILAADVLIYLGNLEPLFDALKYSKYFSKKTIFIFSLEYIDTGTYHLLSSGRFAHSENYIEGLCQRHNFKVRAKEKTIIRKERGKDINGIIFVIQFGRERA
mgnify:CR=1 FL=1